VSESNRTIYGSLTALDREDVTRVLWTRTGEWTAAPEMLAEIERLRDALALLIGTIEAHEIESLQCDRTEERYCNCLRESVARAKALLAQAVARQGGRSDE